MMPRRTRPRAYLAARYSRRDELRGYAEQLRELGLADVEARWLVGTHDWAGDAGSPEALAAAQKFADDDLDDLQRAHLVVVFTEEPAAERLRGYVAGALEDYVPGHTSDEALADEVAARFGRDRGGRHVELGVAIGMGKHVVIVGPAENVFCTHPVVVRYATWADALAHLVRWKDAVEQQSIRNRLVLQ